jgi:site-specific DNA-methyltransferase (cytosine-N4-specific)
MSDWHDVLAGTARWAVEAGGCLDWLRTLPDDSVHCWVTSPPYYGLRDYGTATWEGGDPGCDHRARTGAEVETGCVAASTLCGPTDPQRAAREARFAFRGSCGKCGARRVDEQIGAEPTPGEYVERMVEVMREARRAMHPSGCLWLNLGDSYAAGKTGRADHGSGDPTSRLGPTRDGLPGGTPMGPVRQRPAPAGTKSKDLLLIPTTVAAALRADGWYLRSACPWVKRNPMPESVDDRPGTGCEWVFLLAKRPDYFFDMEAVKRPAVIAADGRDQYQTPSSRKHSADRNDAAGLTSIGFGCSEGGRNLRTSDLWFDSVGMLLAGDDPYPELVGFDVTPERYKGAHFAVMPTRLVEPCVLAGTSARGVCPSCGEPWVRQVERSRQATRPGTDSKVNKQDQATGRHDQVGFNARWKAAEVGNRDPQRHCTVTRTTGWEQGCDCEPAEPIPAVVGDMFTGSGTVARVAVDLGRRFIGCELNEAYHPLIRRRLAGVTPSMFGG